MAITRRSKSDLGIIVDTTTSTRYVYIGWAEHGTATSAAEFYIKRIDKLNGALIEEAEGGDANQVWDDRATLSYAL